MVPFLGGFVGSIVAFRQAFRVGVAGVFCDILMVLTFLVFPGCFGGFLVADSSVAAGVGRVGRSVVEGLAPGVFSGSGSIGELDDAGFSVGHLVDGFVLASGVPVEGGSVLERARGVRDFSQVPVAFRSFVAECAGYVWDGSVVSSVGGVFLHGGFSFGVTPRARWSFGGVSGVDFEAVQEGFVVPASGVGVGELASAVGVELGGLVAPPGGLGLGAGIGELSSFRFDYDGRGSRMSSTEVSNALALEQASYWLSRVGEVDVVSPPLVGESPDVVAERLKRVRRASKGENGVAPRLMGSRREVEIMGFIGLFGWVDVRAVMLLLGVSTRVTALKYLKGLQGRGCLDAVDVPGLGHRVWVGTRVGLDEFGIGGATVSRKTLGNSEFKHRVLVNYVGAMLVNGSVDILGLGGLVSGGRLVGGQVSRGFSVIPDRVIDSAIQGMFRGRAGYDVRDVLIARRGEVLREWRVAGGEGVSPECYGGNEWMWAVMSGASEGKYHVPDIVCMIPRGENGEPRSVAVEVERGFGKKPGNLEKILSQYKDDRSVFGLVVWLCTDDRMVMRVNEWAEANGCAERIRAVRLCRPDGSVFEGISSFEF